jgi:hypothetical protein
MNKSNIEHFCICKYDSTFPRLRFFSNSVITRAEVHVSGLSFIHSYFCACTKCEA